MAPVFTRTLAELHHAVVDDQMVIGRRNIDGTLDNRLTIRSR
jgi:hypothetical protein